MSRPLSEVPASVESEPASESADAFAFALHEVSNALTVVLGWLDLGARSESETELRHALDVAREHAKRGQVLARRAIGAVAESSRGDRPARELVAFVAESLRPAALASEVRIEAESDASADGYVNDEPSLVQVLTNLLLNAVQFSPAHSEVKLDVTRRGDDLVFTVTDQGPGVPRERQSQLFSSLESTREGGAGLGLSHSRSLARQRDGDIRYVPRARGACFEVSWPLARTTAVRPSVHVLPQRVLEGVRILLIEDDAAVSALIDMSCSARGAEVAIVGDSAALSDVLASGDAFDVVLMDLSPLEDCLTAALDEIALCLPRAQVVLVSGQPSGVPSGCEDRFATWMRKPFDMEQLIGAVASVLGERPSGEAPSGQHAL